MPVRSFFDPISGRRETMEVKPIEREQKVSDCAVRFFQVSYGDSYLLSVW